MHSAAQSEKQLQLQTTARCNAACRICPHSRSMLSRAGGAMTAGVFERVLRALARYPGGYSKLALYLQAEPLMDPRWFQRAHALVDALAPRSVELSTNCALLDARATEELAALGRRVSLDVWLSFQGTDRAEFEHWTGLSWEKCLTNLQRFMIATDSEPIARRIQCIGRPHAPARFFDPMWRTLGVRRRPRYAVHPPGSRAGNVAWDVVPHRVRISKAYLGCRRLRDWVHVNWRGQLIPCCMDYENEIVIGSLLEEDLKTLLVRIPEVMAASEAPGFLCHRCELV